MPANSIFFPSLQIVQRGFEDYAHTFAAMRGYTDTRTAESADALWLVEHAPVFTLGLAADTSHILDAHAIPIVQTDRGGEVTYHGPGQAIIYPLLDLRRHQPSRLLPREFVSRIEQAVIDTLAAYNLNGMRKAGAPGIYLADGPWQGAKIAALGLKIRGTGCTYHGVALNVEPDLSHFSGIVPCGVSGHGVTSLADLGILVTLSDVDVAMKQAFQKVFG